MPFALRRRGVFTRRLEVKPPLTLRRPAVPNPVHPEEARCCRAVSKDRRVIERRLEVQVRLVSPEGNLGMRGRDLYLMGRSDLPAPLS